MLENVNVRKSLHLMFVVLRHIHFPLKFDFAHRYLVKEGVKTLDVCYYTGTLNNKGKPESTTILNDLILLENAGNFSDNRSEKSVGCVEYLLANGADVNFSNVSENN